MEWSSQSLSLLSHALKGLFLSWRLLSPMLIQLKPAISELGEPNNSGSHVQLPQELSLVKGVFEVSGEACSPNKDGCL